MKTESGVVHHVSECTAERLRFKHLRCKCEELDEETNVSSGEL